MSKNEKEILKLRNLKKRFGIGDAENYALNGVDLSIKKGEFIIIMGPSGCGKTTLLNIKDCLIVLQKAIIFWMVEMSPKCRVENIRKFEAKKSDLFFRISILFLV